MTRRPVALALLAAALCSARATADAQTTRETTREKTRETTRETTRDTIRETTPATGSASPATGSDSASHRRWLGLPSFGSAPETGLQLGFTVLTLGGTRANDPTRPTGASLYALRSARRQTRIGLDLERWWPGNTRRLTISASALEYPLSFYGIGDRTTLAQEERYTPRSLEGYVQVDERFRGAWYALVGARFGDQSVTTQSPGLLASGALTGAHYTRTVILTAGVSHDTRDNVVATYRGHYASVAYGRSVPTLGATSSYGRFNAELRGYRPLVGTHILAAQLVVVGADGDVPFDQLPVIGGSGIMRGYSSGRFRDKVVTAAQGEYRTPLLPLPFLPGPLKRVAVGGVAFAGVGYAVPTLSADAWRAARALPSVGYGVRVQVDPVQRSAFRLDSAFGRYGFSGLYIGFNQAF